MGTTQDGGNSYLHYQVIEGLGDNSNLPRDRTPPTDNNDVVKINVPINCVKDKNLKTSTKPGLKNLFQNQDFAVGAGKPETK
jgi:hypothetical protein